MPAILFDASVYITAIRMEEDPALSVRRIVADATVWLSSVVLAELYAGTSVRALHRLERLERNFDSAKRVVVPNLRDWTQTGKVLARVAMKYGHEQIGKGRLTNDALIALSAGRLGITVVTANARDFAKLAEFHYFQWRLSDSRAN
jgi:predicted nucleic acid-binding protein